MEERGEEEEADAIGALELPRSQIKHPKSAAESRRKGLLHVYLLCWFNWTRFQMKPTGRFDANKTSLALWKSQFAL